ncbi:MAG: XkdX family protein [Spirochaetales bacterium]|nr:XkdX family protein [Spirochaetales bacterium]
MYEKLKSWYDRNKDKGYAKEFIRRAVEAEKITAAQFTEITGEDY